MNVSEPGAPIPHQVSRISELGFRHAFTTSKPLKLVNVMTVALMDFGSM